LSDVKEILNELMNERSHTPHSVATQGA
jgi:hypothetical protein